MAMMNMSRVYRYIMDVQRRAGKLLAVLIDPEKPQAIHAMSSYLPDVDMILVGGSTGAHSDACIDTLKQYCRCPIVLFPGNVAQFSPAADAVLFLSLLTARSADMLITPHIHIARTILQSGIESIPMGYILVDGGRKSSVEIASNSQPLPRTDVDLIISTAVAGELLGKRLIYLEAGSGALLPIPAEVITAVRASLQVPLIVGGGITTTQAMMDAFHAGADIVVIGNHFEQYPDEIGNFIRIKRDKYGN